MVSFILAVFIVIQSGFIIHLKYCVEVFPLEDGSMCTMEMAEKAPPETSPVFASPLSCCASKRIEANKRFVALLKDIKPLEKFSFSVVSIEPSIPLVQANCSWLSVDRHSHSLPLNQLIVQTAVLLI